MAKPVELGGVEYLPLKVLAVNVRGHVLLAMRVHDLQLVIVRYAVEGADCDEFGNDALSRLENEYLVLEQLGASSFSPKVIAYDAAQHILITEDLKGLPLAAMRLPDSLSGLLQMVHAVAELHRLGFVHRDIKPTNVICDEQGSWLVDYELVARIGTTAPIAAGTVGYIPPEGRHEVAHSSYDIYALGACLSYALLGCCPSRLPRKNNAGRQIGLLRLTGQHAAAGVVSVLTRSDPSLRPSAVDASVMIENALPQMLSEAQSRRQPRLNAANARWIRRAALEAGFATRLFKIQKQVGHCWRNTHQQARLECQAINLGAAGILIGLCSIDEALGTAQFSEDVAGAADWLANQQAYQLAHGLFTGNAGVAVALALVGRRLAREDLLRAAGERFELATSISVPDFDLFSGAAGVVWSSCLLASIVGGSWPLNVVEDLVRRIRENAVEHNGTIGWHASSDFDRTGAVYYGAAHGAAGTAMALAAWGRRFGCEESYALAVDVMKSIYACARTDDGSNILALDSGRVFPPQHWCHGVAGFLWCLMQEFEDSAVLREAQDWAADTLVRSRSCENATMCHGAAGDLEIFRMLSGRPRASDVASRREAEAAAVLRLLHQELGGMTAWSSEDSATFTPDLWVGFLGPGAALALRAGGVRHALLSPEWLGRCASAHEMTAKVK